MKKDEIIAILNRILNDSDNDYEIEIKKSGNSIKSSFTYKVIIYKQYNINEIETLNNKINKLSDKNKDKKILQEMYQKKINTLKNIQNFLENNFYENEYLFNNKIELEKFFNNIINQNNIYSYFNYEIGEVYLQYDTCEFTPLYLIAKIELV